MGLLFSIILGALAGAFTAWFGSWLGVPMPWPAFAGFLVFLLIAFYGRNWNWPVAR